MVYFPERKDVLVLPVVGLIVLVMGTMKLSLAKFPGLVNVPWVSKMSGIGIPQKVT